MKQQQKKTYTIGVDFGTESGRALLVDVATGAEIACEVLPYPDCVIDTTLPGSKKKLPHDWALQNPADYIAVLKKTIPAVLRKGKVKKEDVVGVGIDFTACTCLPIKADGTPLCQLEKFAANPHAWVKLWKHHAAQDEANRINKMAHKRKEDWIHYFGDKLSSEWMYAKIWQVLSEAPEVYKAADRFIEAADWVIMQMTGVEARNACTAGYKAQFIKGKGYPPKSFFKALDPKLENVVEEKLSSDIYPIGHRVGTLTPEMAKLTGLTTNCAVAVANVDAHVAVPAATITSAGKMLMIMGTSICHILLGDKLKAVPGACGVVEDGVIEGFYGYEAGQSGAGDILAWFVKNCVPETYFAEAKAKKMNVFAYLEKLAGAKKPGASGVLALDWINGNRSVLVDVDLTGMFMGMNMQTKTEDMYRALVEALAFGTYTIINNFEKFGIPVKELYACGGLAEKSDFLMQIFSDVTNRTIKIAASGQTPALGSAMFGAVAAGKKAGGYDTIQQAAKKMASLKKKVYTPNKANHAVYQQIYAEYTKLHDYFGRGTNPVMKTLKTIKAKQMDA